MDIIEVLQELNVPYMEEGHHHCTPDFVQVDCPFCSPGWQHWRLGLAINGYVATCWTCGKVNRVEALVELSGQPFSVVKSLLDKIQTRHIYNIAHKGKLVLPHGIKPLLPVHVRYLQGRGFDCEYLEKVWKIKGIGLAPRLSWCVFIPIEVNTGRKVEMVSWTTRTVGDNGLRYISARVDEEALSMKSVLYGEHLTTHGAVVVEGPVDAWRIGPGAVATLGVSYSREQAIRLARFPVRVICFDNEPIAQRQADRLCNELEAFPGKTINVNLDSKDPGSATDNELNLLRRMIR